VLGLSPWEERPLAEILGGNPKIRSLPDPDTVAELLDPTRFVGYAPKMVDRIARDFPAIP
jgi:hypothetical protein